MDEKVIVITGSSAGIGYNLARQFLLNGHSVVINGRNPERLNNAFNDLRQFGKQIISVQGDVSDIGTHKDLVERASENFGKIDIWINNAGIPQPFDEFSKLDLKAVENILKVNLLGTIIGSQIICSYFIQQGHGTLYNMEGFGSDGRMLKKLSIYGTTKRAVRYFTKAMKKELESTDIRLGTINPGMVRTEFLNVNRTFDDERDKKQYDKVLNILAEEPEKVSTYIVQKILENNRSWHAIKYLSGWKLAYKILKLSIPS
jgi:short-subunit dehydrogenase